MATLTVERHIGIRTVEHPIASKAGFFSRVAYTLRKVSFGWSFAGLFLPVGPAYRLSNTLSLKEKAEIDAYRMGL